MGMNEFAAFIKINGCFVVKNIASSPKTIHIFHYPINHLDTRDLLMIPGVSESDIRASLLKGELNHKLRAQEITILCSDIDLLQFNTAHKTFLQNSGIVNGLQIGSGDFATIKREDIQLIGVIDNSNTVYTVPDGIFFYDTNHKIIVYRNGIKQVFIDDFYIAESGGAGSGFDRIIFTNPPISDPPDVDILTADYYVSN